MLRRMRVLAVVVLAGPVVLAFFSGGFFDRARLVAAVLVWVALAVTVLVRGVPWPRALPGRLIVIGLALLSAWTLASIAWAPVPGRALDDGQRLLLYLGFVLLAMAAMRPRSVARWAEPAVAAGAVIVVAYGLAARLVPWLVDSPAGYRTGGRLDQPLTYWNALGALAALGLVLCARIAGDGDRPRGVRAAAAGSASVLGAGIYLTYSRGAIVFAAIGLLALVAFLPRRATVAGAGLAALTAGIGALGVAVFPKVADPLNGTSSSEGGLALVLLVLVGAAAGLAAARRAPDSAPSDRRIARVAFAGIAVALTAITVLVLAGVSNVGTENVRVATGPRAERLRSVESERYDYWVVAGEAFANEPLNGLGSGGFGPEWLREGPADSLAVRDAHSFYVETAAELGLIGIACLLLLLAGAVLAVRGALARDPVLAAGPAAALVAFGVHAGLDWDFEMPALTLPALLLLALLSNAADEPQRGVSTR